MDKNDGNLQMIGLDKSVMFAAKIVLLWHFLTAKVAESYCRKSLSSSQLPSVPNHNPWDDNLSSRLPSVPIHNPGECDRVLENCKIDPRGTEKRGNRGRVDMKLHQGEKLCIKTVKKGAKKSKNIVYRVRVKEGSVLFEGKQTEYLTRKSSISPSFKIEAYQGAVELTVLCN